MKMRPVLFALVSSSLASLPAQSGWKELSGQPVPKIEVDSWLNVDGERPTADTLRGKVWLLEFFATT